jgi:hypothetical protein
VTASIFSLCISSSRFFICLRSLARRFWNHILTYKRKEILAHSSRGTWHEDMSHGMGIWSIHGTNNMVGARVSIHEIELRPPSPKPSHYSQLPVQQPAREADKSFPSSTEVWNAWSYSSRRTVRGSWPESVHRILS